MATDIIARGMITEYKSGANISFTENEDGSVTISASGDVSSEDTAARDAINNHKLDKNNPHNVTAEQVGLGNVDNTADLDKPISTAVQKAIDNKADKTVATTSADGLMSAKDKTKLDGIEEGANKTVVDTALSETSTNPVQNKVVNSALNNKANKSKYGNTTINVGRKYDTTVGDYSTAEGYRATASGNYSHAEGSSTTASGYASHAEGRYITASNYTSHASGHYNAAMTDGGDYNNTTGTAFVIGNGTSSTTLSNAFSVQFSGVVKAKSTITASTTADYAEFFEWLDGNPDDEDRIGYFVTLDGDKIRIATAADDYILGVVSGEPFVLGNGDCDTWNGMFLRDEFRRTIFEPAPKMAEILDSEGNPTGEYEEVEGEFEGTRPKLNPEYDHTQKYISRFDRKEWAPVGMLGVLAVRHDGTAVVNGYVTVNADGIATACEKSTENAYRVIKSNTENVVEIIFR